MDGEGEGRLGGERDEGNCGLRGVREAHEGDKRQRDHNGEREAGHGVAHPRRVAMQQAEKAGEQDADQRSLPEEVEKRPAEGVEEGMA
jgi:hypothetical protein